MKHPVVVSLIHLNSRLGDLIFSHKFTKSFKTSEEIFTTTFYDVYKILKLRAVDKIQ